MEAMRSRSGQQLSTCRQATDTCCSSRPIPFWRGQTKGSYFLVFNAIMNWDNLNAGRKLAEK